MNFSKIQFSFKLEDILVVLWLFTEIIFPYTSISRIVLLATVLFLFLKKGINSKLKFNLMLLFLFIIILYSIIRIPYIDNGSDHISMISTISINIIFLF